MGWWDVTYLFRCHVEGYSAISLEMVPPAPFFSSDHANLIVGMFLIVLGFVGLVYMCLCRRRKGYVEI